MNLEVALSGSAASAASAASASAPASWSRWEGLSPDVLALIFSRIPADKVLRTVQFVCRSWRDALIGPCCWANIDIELWCRRVNNSIQVDAAVEKLVRRSGYTHNRMAAYRLGNLGFGHAVSSGRFLTVLEIIMGEVTDQMVEIHAPFLPNLTKLDISYCLEISSKGIEYFGKNCKFLAHLRRTMPPPPVDPYQGTVDVEEEEAFAIANTMPKLHYLELNYARFSNKGLDAILTKCPALSDLDIRGCLNVKMEGEIGNKCVAIHVGMWSSLRRSGGPRGTREWRRSRKRGEEEKLEECSRKEAWKDRRSAERNRRRNRRIGRWVSDWSETWPRTVRDLVWSETRRIRSETQWSGPRPSCAQSET